MRFLADGKRQMNSQQTKLPITIIIITHRQDENFIHALASSQFADEVLIFDHQSGNNWSALKQHYTFTLKNISKQGELNNFAKIRNQTLDQAKNNWVFFLDSDEVIQPTSINQIKEIITNQQLSGATIIRQDYFLNKKINYGEAGKKKILRLMKKDQAHFERDVHEIASCHGQVADSSILINHYPHPTINAFIKAVARYAYLEAVYRFQRGQKFSLLQLLIYPSAKFIYNFFFKLGFLDGWRGLIYALIMSIHSISVRINLYELSQTS